MSKTEILIADGNAERGQRVADALEAAGHTTRLANQGAGALEIALADQPKVIVAEVDLGFVDALKLAEILRANPRTHDVRFLFLGGDDSAGRIGGVGDARLDADAEIEDVLAEVSALFDRQQRVESLEDRASAEFELAGSLSELRPAELLRMLHLRGASGTLYVEPDEEGIAGTAAEVRFSDGEIFAAEIGPIRNEKALFRVLSWRNGCFDFEAGEVDGGAEIKTPTRSVLAEGMRQLDEWRRLAPKFPPLDSPVRLVVDRAELPQIVHPLTQEVLALLGEERCVGDIVDHCSEPDYQVLRTLFTLSERGIAEFGRAKVAKAAAKSGGALFGEMQERRLRTFVTNGVARDEMLPDAKLLVIAASTVGLGRFASLLERVPGVDVSPRCLRAEIESDALEPIGRIEVDADFGIDLVHLPAAASFAPLWPLAGHRALGTIILLDATLGESAARLASAAQSLMGLPGARTFHVVLIGEGERLSPGELRENLALIDEASLFLLPVESKKDPGSLLRSLFARIVP